MNTYDWSRLNKRQLARVLAKPEGVRMKALRVFTGVVCGAVVALVLFPFSGTTGCAGGEKGGYCKSWAESMLLRYEGENATPWMLAAVGAGLVVGVGVYFSLRGIARMKTDRRDAGRGVRGS